MIRPKASISYFGVLFLFPPSSGCFVSFSTCSWNASLFLSFFQICRKSSLFRRPLCQGNSCIVKRPLFCLFQHVRRMLSKCPTSFFTPPSLFSEKPCFSPQKPLFFQKNASTRSGKDSAYSKIITFYFSFPYFCWLFLVFFFLTDWQPSGFFWEVSFPCFPSLFPSAGIATTRFVWVLFFFGDFYRFRKTSCLACLFLPWNHRKFPGIFKSAWLKFKRLGVSVFQNLFN